MPESRGSKPAFLGSCKPVGDGVFELKDDFGPGYRIYFVEDGKDIILLLCAGDKSNQQTDIGTAKNYWTDHQRRKKQAKSNEKKKHLVRR
jgi:putative addiction module killer protein